MRLTEKKNANYLKEQIGNENFVPSDEDLRYAKLGQLEDIEEEIGIDLITLFKMLRDGIIVEDYKTISFKEVALSYSEDRKSWHFMFKQELPLNQRIGVFVKSSKCRYAFKEE